MKVEPKVNTTMERICNTTTKPQCIMVKDQKYETSFEQICEDVVASPCDNNTVMECVKNEMAITSSNLETVCVEFKDSICRTVVETVVEMKQVKECQNTCPVQCVDTSRTQCNSVEREESVTKYEDECEMVKDEVCHDGYEEECTTEYTKECEFEGYKEVCQDIPKKVCSTPRICELLERHQCKMVSPRLNFVF
jgi:hypothetical protein